MYVQINILTLLLTHLAPVPGKSQAAQSEKYVSGPGQHGPAYLGVSKRILYHRQAMGVEDPAGLFALGFPCVYIGLCPAVLLILEREQD